MYCKSYKEVYKYYESVASSFKNKGLKILKTDTHNESLIWEETSIPLAPILQQGNELTLIEIDPDTLQKAKNNYPDINMHQGDILTWKGKYDLILDFSTIDHVEDYCKVLVNYRKMSPNVSLVVWLNTCDENLKNKTEDQFYFSPDEFKKNLRLIYGNFEEMVLYGENLETFSIVLCHFKAGEVMKNCQSVLWQFN